MAVAAGLYFTRKDYFEDLYENQPAGSIILQVHAMSDVPGEEPHYRLCHNFLSEKYKRFFHMDRRTGILYLNQTMTREDFDKISKFVILAHELIETNKVGSVIVFCLLYADYTKQVS